MAYGIQHTEGAVTLSHPAGEYKASFDLSRFFGRDALREIVERMDFVEEDITFRDDEGRPRTRKLFHNDHVVLAMTKDPWVDYESPEAKERQEPVFKEKWGKHNPLRPARSGYMRLIGDKSEVVRCYDLIRWRTIHKDSWMNGWGV